MYIVFDGRPKTFSTPKYLSDEEKNQGWFEQRCAVLYQS